MKKLPKEIKLCKNPRCRKTFEVSPWEKGRKFCSKKCYHSFILKERRKCKNPSCKNVFEVLKNSSRKYCCKKCYWENKIGVKQSEEVIEKRISPLRNKYKLRKENRKCLQCENDFECSKQSLQKYCSTKCANMSRRGNIPWNKKEREKRTCTNSNCNKIFEVSINSTQKYCSKECYRKDIRRCIKGKCGRKMFPRKIRICPVCKKGFEVVVSSKRIFCSIRCSSKNKEGKPRPEISGENSSSKRLEVRIKIKNSLTGNPKVISSQRKRFEDPVERNKMRLNRIGKHQSEESKEKNRIASLKNWQNPEYVKKVLRKCSPNKPESFLIELFQQFCPNKYKYVGNGKFSLAGKNPDFVNIDGQKKIIEHFGDFHHGEERTGISNEQHVQERIDLFAKYGYKTLIIWEHELEDVEKLVEKIFVFNGGK